MDKNNFIFTSELIDVTFLQLQEEYRYDPEIAFLDSYNGSFDEEDPVFIFQYPKAKLSFAIEFIEYSPGFNYFHNGSTDSGSSGFPLLNRYMEVIGIHKGSFNRDFNYATKFNIVKDIINRLYYKSYIKDIKKAREPARILSDDEEKELTKHGLKKSKHLSNMCINVHIIHPQN